MASIAPPGALVRARRPVAATGAPSGVRARGTRMPLAASCAQRKGDTPDKDRLAGHKRSSDQPCPRPAKRPRPCCPAPIPPVPPRETIPPASKARPAPRPKDAGWIDLDQEDDDDPLMVSEYVNDIFAYMRRIEVQALPNPDYIDHQDDLTWAQRCKVINWLISLHHKFRLVPETLFLAVNIVDRMLSVRYVSLARLQLLAATALFLAAKYEEVLAPSVENFAYVALSGEQDVLQAERYILRTLNFDLSYPNPMNFLRRISKADAYDIQTRTVAKYLMEISTLDARLLAHPPSVIAGAALYLAREVLERGSWTPTLVHYSGYAEAELLGTASILLDYTLRPTETTHKALFTKYASQRFMRASAYVQHWAQRSFPAAHAHYQRLADSSTSLLHVRTLAVDLYRTFNIPPPSADDMRELFGCPPPTPPQPSDCPLAHLPAPAEQDDMETKQFEFSH